MRARKAGLADVADICRICRDAWRDTYAGVYDADEIERIVARYYSRERVREEVRRPEDWDGWWVAEDDAGRIVAAGGGGMTAPCVGEVFVLYADPPRRGEGAGTAILAAVTEEQRSQGAREQSVSVEPQNENGLRFYRARGFRRRGSRPLHGNEPGDDRVSLRLSRRI